MSGRLGIIAGGGTFPGRVAAASTAAGRPVFIVGLQGFAEPAVLAPYPHEVIRIGAAGRIVAALRKHGCDRVLMIGPVRRPSVLSLRPDAEGARILARIGRAAFGGDDGLLAAIIRVFREEGFEVVGAQDVLREALAPVGLLTRTAPDAAALADIRRGIAVTLALGRVDVGQGCVVQQGLVLAVEAVEGTDAMLGRCAALARRGPGGVLVKLVKPGQERRADLPTLGLATVQAARDAGLRGIAYEGEGALLADRDAAIAVADAAGLFLLGLDPADVQSENGVTGMAMFLHTMLRVGDLERSIRFYVEQFGMRELRRNDVPDGKYTLAFVGYGDESSHTVLELTYNYGVETYDLGTAFGHLAIGVPDVAAACERMRAAGVKITREPGPVKFGTTIIAFVEDPDGYKIELIQRS